MRARPALRTATLAAATAALAACAPLQLLTAVTPAGTGAAAPAAIGLTTSAPRPPGAAPVTGTPSTTGTPSAPTQPPFATVIKDARRVDGPLTLWHKDEKVWIELMPEQIGQPFLLSPKIKSGIGEAMVLGGLMSFPVNGAGGAQIVEFVRVHNQVRLQSRNTDVTAPAGTPEARAVADSYSHSLLGAVPVASQPHPDRKSVLVEAGPLFVGDIPGIGMMLQRGLRQGYGLDRGNSLITAVRGSEHATTIETQHHYYTASVAAPLAGLLPGMPAPAVPRFLPDARSMLVTLNYSLVPLPAQPMPVRRADPRVGLFTTTVLDFADDLRLTPRQRYVHRWRLEKKDPAAELSPPVRPITFWIDRNVPLLYRDTVREAILEWNKAFERIGFKDAIAVAQQPDDAKFDTLDAGYASVRWMMNADPVFAAIGPSHVDPRTGEILDADIAFEGMSTRSIRGLRSQVLSGQAIARAFGAYTAPHEQAGADAGAAELARCRHGELAAEQLGYALDVLQARGDLDPESPEAQQFVRDHVRESIMHEVGHALGLRHNFRASRAYTEAQLSDPEFTRTHGTTGSVMEYNAVNLPSPGKSGGTPFQSVLGPYDYWAIEYAYKPLPPGTTAEQERIELQRVAARGTDPLLAFGTDEDNFFALDPETLQLDLGSDPVAFAAKRLAIARDLFARQETRELSPQRDYAVLRRALGYAIADVTRAVGVLARQIGGVRTLRDYPGSGRDPLQPVAADVQRRSLDLMASAVLAPGGLHLSAALQRRLAPDFLDRADSAGGPTDFAVPQRLLDLQRAVLAYLMGDALAARVLDSAAKFDHPRDAFHLSEVYQRLAADVWSEIDPASLRRLPAQATPARARPEVQNAAERRDSQTAPERSELQNLPMRHEVQIAPTGRGLQIAPARRELQREHVGRVAAGLLRPGARADARSLLRVQARALLARLQNAQRRHATADRDTRMHLDDAVDTLRQALAAQVQRQAL